ncbi:MAG: hypothetical protein HOJ13_08015 [Nitrospina sp.]|jgi:hypothetical protein|nr:hypothetical protein [Nitrospina sp.]
MIVKLIIRGKYYLLNQIFIYLLSEQQIIEIQVKEKIFEKEKRSKGKRINTEALYRKTGGLMSPGDVRDL